MYASLALVAFVVGLAVYLSGCDPVTQSGKLLCPSFKVGDGKMN